MAIRFFLILFFLLVCVPQSDAHSLIIDADAQYAYAESCFKEKNFEQAANEFKRFLHFFPEDARLYAAEYQIGLSYFNIGQFQFAEDTFRKMLNRTNDSAYVNKALFMIYECRLKSNDFDGASAALRVLIQGAKDDDTRDEARYRLAWFWIEAASWQNAKDALNTIGPENRNKYHVAETIAEIDTAHTLPQKDPAISGMLSILPGAGHLYCGRFQDAAVAFLLNAALIGSAIEAFDHDLSWLGGAITLFEAGIYSGTIYSAVGSAHKFNRQETGKFIRGLKRHAVSGLSIAPAPGGFHLALTLAF
ncbi:MAG: tetratricopeptide repeat protein [Desulfobacterales bacterium]|jgi:tetratricopeptide (TPR) repeat protein|nr:tetratricopeptide repeat protein [Desulfobacterales bacterium]